MKKNLIITGNARSGKSFLARSFTSKYGDKNKIFIDCRRKLKAKNIIDACSRDTEIIIFDDVTEYVNFSLIRVMSERGIDIIEEGFENVTIFPKIIIVMNQDHVINFSDSPMSKSSHFFDTKTATFSDAMKLLDEYINDSLFEKEVNNG